MMMIKQKTGDMVRFKTKDGEEIIVYVKEIIHGKSVILAADAPDTVAIFIREDTYKPGSYADLE